MNPKHLALLVSFLALTAVGQHKPAYSDAEAGKHAGEEATVTGKVVTVSTSGKGTTYLNFGDRFPRQTFSGVVFARNGEAVGDMKQYEGKEVALTGRIEMSPDQKPQIVISRPDQVKLVGANTPAVATPMPAPSAPTPAPVVATQTPAPSTSPAPPSPAVSPSGMSGSGKGKISLAMNWNSPGQGGEMTRKDLAKIFGGSGTAGEATEVDTTIEVYPGIRFLTPLAEAKKILHLEGVPFSAARIATPGLPQGSFNATTCTGVFAGGFTRIYLMTDNADQVVSVLVVEANTRARTPNETDTTGYHTYNFITGGAKAVNDHMIKHEIAETAPAGVVVVNSLFIDPTDAENPPPRSSKSKSSSSSKPKTGKVLERSRWFVPVPIVNLILRSVVQ